MRMPVRPTTHSFRTNLSKLTLEPGDEYSKTTENVKEEKVVLKQSDMIMTQGDINQAGGRASTHLAIARVLGSMIRPSFGFGVSTRSFRARG